jgi:hypothetical protein
MSVGDTEYSDLCRAVAIRDWEEARRLIESGEAVEGEVPFFDRNRLAFVRAEERYRSIDSVVAWNLAAYGPEDKPLFTEEERAKQTKWQRMLTPVVAPLLKMVMEHENKAPKNLLWLHEHLKARS